ncbi:MAG: hypothetical protein GY809_26480 [Planctomycetes bacterium]|nr:hypothetical protein [Planctomycetota bacterium]
MNARTRVVAQGWGWLGCILCVCFVSPAVAGESIIAATDLRPLWDTTTPLSNPHKGSYPHYYDNGMAKYLVKKDADLLAFPVFLHRNVQRLKVAAWP